MNKGINKVLVKEEETERKRKVRATRVVPEDSVKKDDPVGGHLATRNPLKEDVKNDTKSKK